MDLGLQGRVVLITGASQGIGRATATMFAAEGANVILVARTRADLEKVRAEILQIYPDCVVEVAAHDLSNSAEIDRLVQAHADIDILVNNAGSIAAGSLDQLSGEDVRSGWELKVFGYIDMTRRYLALMSARRSGVIINVIGGRLQNANYIAGETGNAALANFTQTLGGNSPVKNVRVIGVDPGPILTPRLIAGLKRAAAIQFGDAERYEELISRMPFGRAGKPEEVAATIAFLASDHAGYISGALIAVDGGVTARHRAY